MQLWNRDSGNDGHDEMFAGRVRFELIADLAHDLRLDGQHDSMSLAKQLCGGSDHSSFGELLGQSSLLLSGWFAEDNLVRLEHTGDDRASRQSGRHLTTTEET
jgi:hypothetical protein